MGALAPIERATMAYGYGLSVSLLQMAHAYTALARNGDMISLSLVKNRANPTSIQIYKPETARAVRQMLEDAAGSEGTKIQGKVMGYRIGGKSGTARKIIDGRYSRKDYRAHSWPWRLFPSHGLSWPSRLISRARADTTAA